MAFGAAYLSGKAEQACGGAAALLRRKFEGHLLAFLSRVGVEAQALHRFLGSRRGSDIRHFKGVHIAVADTGVVAVEGADAPVVGAVR